MSVFKLNPEVDLMIAIPTRGRVRMEWALMFRDVVPPTNSTWSINVIPDLDVVEARNVAAKTAWDNEVDYLFFLDDDTFCGPQVLRGLHNKMLQNPEWDMLTGITPMKTPDCEPNIYRGDSPGAYWGWTMGETFEIDACGLSCALIKRSALEKVGEPWFDWVETRDGTHTTEMGEDVGFCKKLKDAGGIIYADGSAICGHINTETGKFFQFSDQAAPIKRGFEKAAAQKHGIKPVPAVA